MFAVLIFLVLLIFWLNKVAGDQSSVYPDGKCYLCRRGQALPGETCPKCGTDQP